MKTSNNQIDDKNINGIISIGDGCYSKINAQEKKVFNFRGEVILFLIIAWCITIFLAFTTIALGIIQGWNMLVLILAIFSCFATLFSMILSIILVKKERKIIVIDEKINYEPNVKVVIKKIGIDILTFDENNYLEKFQWTDFNNFKVELADLTSEYLFGMSIKSKTVRLANHLAILNTKSNQRILFYINSQSTYNLLKINISNDGLPDELIDPTEQLVK